MEDYLYKSLAKARREFPPIVKDSVASGGKFSYKYANLPNLLDTVEPILYANNLYIDQRTDFVDGVKLLKTKIVHFITKESTPESIFPLTIEKPDPSKNEAQQDGSNQTYHRRYQIMLVLGLCGVDDDNDGAYVPTHSNVSPERSDCISPKQVGLLKVRLKGNVEREKKLCSHYNIASLEYLPRKKMEDVLSILDRES